MINESTLSDLEKRIVNWLIENQELKLKDFFLADLSWATTDDDVLDDLQDKFGYPTNRKQAIVNFFTKRTGKRVLEILPEDIKNYVLANSI